MEANGVWILALWVAFEQFVAASDKLKANSTLQLIINAGKKILGKFASK
jgi:hypothetical protein